MDLKDRLKSLGLKKGAADLKRPRREGADIHHLVEGEVVQNTLGSFFLTEQRYPLDYRHGQAALGEALEADLSGLHTLTGRALGEKFDLRQALFIDTETTGLAGGTGTYAFLVGVGFFQDQDFRLLQFFMRDYHEEPALLHHLTETFRQGHGLVSFNGRVFDVPLLQTRWMATRLEPAWRDTPHLDLLPPSRRLWRARVGSCSLSSLEQNVLGIHRTTEDVPGWLIPSLYFRYVQTRDAREMKQVLYHNAQDILSLVTLACRLTTALSEPLHPRRHALDAFSLARWFQQAGQEEEAEDLYRQALAGPLPLDERRQALLRLAALLKRQGRREEAVPLWRSLTSDPALGLTALEELAKWAEWHAGDLKAALRWTEQALRWAEEHLHGVRRRRARADLEHRRRRVQRKLAGQRQAADGP